MKDSHKNHPHPPWEEMRKNPCMLCGEVSRILHQRMRECSERAGINLSYQLDLVRATHLAAPTVSVTLQKMEQEGLITRKTDSSDQRQLLVYITQAGRELHDRAREQIVKTEDRALAGITPEERQTLLAILTRMRDNLIEERSAKANHETD